MDQIIYLDADDDMATVRERLSCAQSDRVSLVVPARSRLFRNLIDLKLLRRHADRLGLKVTLVTGDWAIRGLAGELGIPVRFWAPRGKSARAATARSDPEAEEKGVGDAQEPGSAPLNSGAAGTSQVLSRPVPVVRPGAGFVPRPADRLSARRASSLATAGQRIVGYLLLLVVLAASLLGALLLVPEAIVELTPASEAVTRTITVKAATDVRSTDVAKGQVPARLVQVTIEESEQTDSTGQRQEPAQKATGRVVITNRSGSPVNVPQGTALRTGTGTLTRFFTSAVAEVPASGSVQVPIVAELAGPGGNLPASAISQVEGSLSFQLSVVNDTPTSGGTEQKAALVTAADRQRLRDSLYARMKAGALQAVKADLKPGEVLLESGITTRVEDESFDREINAVSKSVGLRMRMAVSTLAVPADGLRKLAEAAVEAGQTSGGDLVSGSIAVGAPQDVSVEGSTATFRLEARAVSVVGLDVQQVRSDIQGLSVAQAEQVLVKNYRLNRDPDITLHNGWLGRLPLIGFRIHVVVAP